MKSLILRYLGFIPYFFTPERLQEPSLHIKKKKQENKTKQSKKQVNANKLPASVCP